jgi:hypothetical protein
MLSRRTRPRAASRASRSVTCAWAFLLAALLAAPARAGLRIVEQGVSVDATARRAAFRATFDSPPDLFTRDEFGRLADSFQYEIDADGPASAEAPVGDVDAVVRGDEIDAAGALRVRAAGEGVEPDPDPIAGGWGPVRTAVPFNLDGAELSFEVPLADLGDTDGKFSYRLFTVEFGLTVDQVEGVVGAAPALPLPPAAWSACATVAGFGLFALLRRRSLR